MSDAMCGQQGPIALRSHGNAGILRSQICVQATLAVNAAQHLRVLLLQYMGTLLCTMFSNMLCSKKRL